MVCSGFTFVIKSKVIFPAIYCDIVCVSFVMIKLLNILLVILLGPNVNDFYKYTCKLIQVRK